MSPANIMKSLACAVIAIVAIVAVAWSVAPPAHGAEQQTLEIASKTGVHVFAVELAVTDDELFIRLLVYPAEPPGALELHGARCALNALAVLVQHLLREIGLRGMRRHDEGMELLDGTRVRINGGKKQCGTA